MNLDALVIGAGPTGLTMAAELRRHGLSCRIVDKVAAPSDKSKALVVQARTLEVFESMGLITEALARGQPIKALSPYFDGRRVGLVTFDAVDSPHPFPLILEQSETEHMLIGHLRSLGLEVERQCELDRFQQDGEGVEAELKHADGRRETVRARWLLGCDGSHSAVRHGLGLPFDGVPYEEEFLLADARVQWSLPNDTGHGFITRKGVFAVIPMRNGYARIITFCREHPLLDGQEPGLQDFQALADRFAPPGTVVRDPLWMARFRVHCRIAPRFREGRVFLAGDAAHIHSPAGGQGMNTGIQDAFNLAWKLALVTSGAARPEILESYNAERHPVAEKVLRTTDAMFRSAIEANAFMHFLRCLVGPWVLRQKWIRRLLTNFVSEIGIHYRASPIVSGHGAHLFDGGPSAGDRAPDVNGLKCEDGSVVRLFDILRHPAHTLLLVSGENFTGESSRSFESIAQAVQKRCGTHVRIQAIIAAEKRPAHWKWTGQAILDPAKNAHRRYGTREAGIYLVRPDGYVAFRGQPPDEKSLLEYLDRIFLPV